MTPKPNFPDLAIGYNDQVEVETMPGYVFRVIGVADERCPCPDVAWHPEWIVKDASGDMDYLCSLQVRKVT